MQFETLRDILHWTGEFHQYLANCLQEGEDHSESERAKMLLKYLGEHEQKLVTVLDGFEKTASENALNTWCLEYFDRHPIKRHEQFDLPLSDMEPGDIITEIINLHQQVIELYRYLHTRAEPYSSKELLSQLADLEQHEAMRMAQSANQLEDM